MAIINEYLIILQNPEFGTSDAVTEAQQNLLQIQEEIRKIEVTTTKANARLDLLRDNGSKSNEQDRSVSSSLSHS